MQLKLKRKGYFQAVGMESGARCGHVGTPTFYRYLVEVEATSERMSPEGFVIEHSRIHSYLLDTYASGLSYPAISCERMAMAAATHIGNMLVAEHISVTSVTVTIQGGPDASISATWR